tara:strand:+ start:786 stop:1028 length:243 start_codon:yes stop_codon:yes gene_type:complete
MIKQRINMRKGIPISFSIMAFLTDMNWYLIFDKLFFLRKPRGIPTNKRPKPWRFLMGIKELRLFGYSKARNELMLPLINP